jgi:ATP-dependent Clp protease ATP-binding subunit ClpB
LRRAIQSYLENPLARDILEGRFGPKDVIVVDYVNGAFTFAKEQPQAKAA